MEPCRFAILGAGRIAEKFAQTFITEDVGNAVITAVASTDAGRAQAFAQKHSIAKSYGSYAALFADEAVDVIYIATTNNVHRACCLAAIAAGKHVLCEKPLAMNGADAEEIAKAAQEKGVFLMEAMWSRFLPAVQQAKKWVEEGKIGTPLLFSGSLCQYRSPQEYQRLYDPSLGGGAMLDLGVYPLEMMLYFAGERTLRKLVPLAVRTAQGVDVTSLVQARYEDGFVGEVRCSIGFQTENKCCVYGTAGAVYLFPNADETQAAHLYSAALLEAEPIKAPKPDCVFEKSFRSGFEFQIAHVAACIKQGLTESPVMPLRDTIACAHIFDLIAKEVATQ